VTTRRPRAVVFVAIIGSLVTADLVAAEARAVRSEDQRGRRRRRRGRGGRRSGTDAAASGNGNALTLNEPMMGRAPEPSLRRRTLLKRSPSIGVVNER
jgi:hypothetical protein